MYTKQIICSLVYIMLVPTIQAQNDEFDSWPGNVSVLIDQPLTLSWTHSLSNPDIEWCYYQFRSPKTSPDEFLGWDNNLKKRLNISDNQLGWRFLNIQYPCLGGIKRDRAESQHAGNYRFYVITTQGEEYFDSRAHITVVEGAGLRYSLTVGEKEHEFVLSEFDTELDPIEVTEDDTLPLKLKLLDGFAPSNLSILKQDKGWEAASVTCSQKQECRANFSANKDTVNITASIETSVQGISQIRINQPISYSSKEHSTVGLFVAVVFLVVFLLLLIILLICLCYKKARHLKKVRKYLLRKHDDLALKEELKNLRSDVETLTGEKNSIQIANRTLDERNKELDEEIEVLKREKDSLSGSLREKTIECNKLTTDKSDLQDKLDAKDRELTRTKQEAQTEKDKMGKQHEDEVNKLNARIKELERQPKKPGGAVRQESGDAGGELDFTDSFEDQVLTKGQELKLSATFSVKPKMVLWFRDRDMLEDGIGTGVKLKNENNTYTIRIKADRVKPGMYQCQARDRSNKPVIHNAIVTIGESKEGDKTSGNSPPMFTDTGDLTDKFLGRHEPLELSVGVSGSPTPVVTWYRDNKLMRHFQGRTDISQSEGRAMLTVTPTNLLDVAGKYYCEAVNDYGHVQSQVIMVQVGEPAEEATENSLPAFTDTSDLTDKFLVKNVPLNLSVEVSGSPLPVVTWYRDTRPLRHFQGRTDLSQSEGRAMLKVTPTSYGNVAGKYYCEAANDYGHVQSQVISVRVGTWTAPRFRERLSDKRVREGSRAFFQAKVDGFPPPDFKWFKDNVLLSNTDRIKIEAKNVSVDYLATLTLEHFSVEDVGLITLVATNDAGSEECSANLSVSDTSGYSVSRF